MVQEPLNDLRDHAYGLIDGMINNEWTTDQEAQEHICMEINDIVAYLEKFPVNEINIPAKR